MNFLSIEERESRNSIYFVFDVLTLIRDIGLEHFMSGFPNPHQKIRRSVP